MKKDGSQIQETFLFRMICGKRGVFLKAFKGVAKYMEPTDFFLPNYGWQKYVGLIARNSAGLV